MRVQSKHERTETVDITVAPQTGGRTETVQASKQAVARDALTPFTRSKPERKYLANNLGLLVNTSRAGATPHVERPPRPNN